MALEGDMILLREERAEDMPFLVALRNDLETQAWNTTLPPDYTLPMYVKRFEAREFAYDHSDGRFIVVHKVSQEPAGTISYTNLEPRFSASFGLMVAKKFWGTGVALDAQEVLLKFMFTELGLRVVRLWTNSGNPRAVALAQKSGFQVSLRRREAVFRNGELFDHIGMDLLREEYFARHPDLTDHLPAR